MESRKGIGEKEYQPTVRNKTLKFSTNKPFIVYIQIPDFPWTWKLIEGELRSQSAHDAIIEALEAQLRGKSKPDGGLYAA